MADQSISPTPEYTSSLEISESMTSHRGAITQNVLRAFDELKLLTLLNRAQLKKLLSELEAAEDLVSQALKLAQRLRNEALIAKSEYVGWLISASRRSRRNSINYLQQSLRGNNDSPLVARTRGRTYDIRSQKQRSRGSQDDLFTSLMQSVQRTNTPLQRRNALPGATLPRNHLGIANTVPRQAGNPNRRASEGSSSTPEVGGFDRFMAKTFQPQGLRLWSEETDIGDLPMDTVERVAVWNDSDPKGYVSPNKPRSEPSSLYRSSSKGSPNEMAIHPEARSHPTLVMQTSEPLARQANTGNSSPFAQHTVQQFSMSPEPMFSPSNSDPHQPSPLRGTFFAEDAD